MTSTILLLYKYQAISTSCMIKSSQKKTHLQNSQIFLIVQFFSTCSTYMYLCTYSLGTSELCIRTYVHNYIPTTSCHAYRYVHTCTHTKFKSCSKPLDKYKGISVQSSAEYLNVEQPWSESLDFLLPTLHVPRC